MKSTKKQIISILAVLTMAILLSCAFVACDKTGSQKSDYKITVHPNNGQADFAWDVNTDIPVITKDGYHIVGYYLDAEMTKSTSFESLKSTKLTQDIDVYVKWEENACEHVEVIDAAVEPTCTEPGLTEGKHCSVCNEILKAQKEISALGHDIEHHAGQPATCTEKGWEEYDTCKREGCDYTTYKEILAGHNFDNNQACTVCGYFETGLSFELNEDGESYSVVGIGTFNGADLKIPKANFDAKPVTSIGKEAFLGCTDIVSVTIPESITNIGSSAFQKCKGITSIYYKGDINEWCNITGLGYLMNRTKTLYIKGVKIEGALVIPNTVENIGSSAFYGCVDLTSVTIPNSVTNIGSSAFFGCTGLTNIVIPDSVTTIGFSAFQECSGLSRVTIGKGVKSIEGQAFLWCKKLQSIIIPDNVTSLGHSAFSNCMELTSAKLGNGVTNIADRMFDSCYKLANITFGNNVKTIGKSAFSMCDAIISISIPNTVTSLGDWAFGNSANLTSVYLPDGITSIGSYAFHGCTSLKNIGIPTSVKSIGKGAFWNCSELATIAIPDNVTRIEENTFTGCSSLTNITIGKYLTSIGNEAFSSCKNLKRITFKGTTTQWGKITKGTDWKKKVHENCIVVCENGTTSP